jgi:hypothetical protein
MATSSPPVAFSNHHSITHGVGAAKSSSPFVWTSDIPASTEATDTAITPAVPNNSLPATDEARAVISNSFLSLVSDAPTSIEPMAAPGSAAGSCVRLHTLYNTSWTSPDTFHFFPKLAPELRLKIWNDALPDSRTVEVEVCGGSGNMCEWWASAESKQTPCGLLLVSKESRYVYLKHWLPLFRYVPLNVKFCKDLDQTFKLINVSDSRFPLCYFNLKIDMLYLGCYNSNEFFNNRIAFGMVPLKSLARIPGLQ